MGLSGFKLDTDNDLATEANDFVICTDTEYLAQKIKCTLQTYYGEWWLDITLGIPYFQDILTKNPDMGVVRNIFTAAILGVEGVQSIKTLNLSVDTTRRTLTVSFEVKAKSGGTATGEVTI